MAQTQRMARPWDEPNLKLARSACGATMPNLAISASTIAFALVSVAIPW
jgi:hypothetical protein